MIRNLWKHDRKDSLVRDSFLLFSAGSIVNLGAFIFHLIMGRLLGPINYGVLGTLLTILYIVNVPVNVTQTIITKFVSQFNALNEQNNIKILIRKSFKKLFILGIIVTLITMAISPAISNFLHISNSSLLILSPILLLSVMLPIVRGNLQGLQKFKLLGFNLITEIIVKLGLGILLVYLGLKVNGAIIAIVLSFLLPLLIGLPFIKDYTKKAAPSSFDHKKVYSFSYPVLVALTLMSLLFTMDVLLVKHLFNETSAGLYVAASIIGKIIFFGTFAISQVMFPKSVERHSLNKPSNSILKKSLFLVLLFATPVTLFYFIFPRIITTILFGKEYLQITNLLGFFGVAITLFSLSYMLILYNLSIGKTNLSYFLMFSLTLETFLIYLIHNSLFQVTLILTLTMVIVFIYLLLYTINNLRWLASQ